MRPSLLRPTRELLKDADPDVRLTAQALFEPADPVNRALAAAPLLTAAVRGVRIAAARGLAGILEA